jgi:hypothetical protein
VVDPTPSPFPRGAIWIASFVVLALSAAFEPPLAVPGCVVVLILGLSLPEMIGKARWVSRAALASAVLGCLVGLARFATSKAMLGIIETGESASAQNALSRVREIVSAEDAARLTAPYDPDGDHVGSALLVTELAGAAPLGNGARLDPALLNYTYHHSIETALGPAADVEGYLFVVCLPTKSGGWNTERTDIDDDLSERRFLVYGWPSEIAEGMTTVFFTDEHERILVLDLPRGSPPRYLGAGHPPPCDATLGGPVNGWTTWRNKAPRNTLPGDTEKSP